MNHGGGGGGGDPGVWHHICQMFNKKTSAVIWLSDLSMGHAWLREHD